MAYQNGLFRKATSLTSFAELSLADDINRAIRDSGYEKPTLIQQQMIPIIANGDDVIGVSQTGTGKTAAFVLPILDHLATSKKRASRGNCSVLVLSPTRELSNQIADTVRRYGKYVNYNQAIIVGGVSYPPQIRALQRGTDIVIATPGRVLDHIESGVMRLDDTTMVVLDEADQMLDFGFLPVIRKILGAMPNRRQMVLLSATMPKAVQELTKEFMDSPQKVEATPESRPVEAINQQVIYVEKPRKNMALLEILSQKEVERSIVFTRTKFGADRVQKFLNNYGILAVSLHGNKSQGQRQRALGQFRSGEATVLVATDIAGRGIDIDDVSHVINVDLPNIPESYVHRIGRTARAGRNGVAISFCAKGERSFLRDIEKLIGTKLPKREDQPGSVKLEPSEAPVNLDAPKGGNGGGNRGSNKSSRSRGEYRGERGSRSGPHGSSRSGSRDGGSGRKPFRASNSNRPDRPDRSERPNRGERPNRADRPNRASNSNRADRADRWDSAERPQRGDRPFREDRRPRRDDRDDREQRADRSDRPRRDDRSDRPRREDRSDRPRRDDRPRREDRSDRPRRDTQKQGADRPHREDRDQRDDRPQRDDRKSFAKKHQGKPKGKTFARSGGKTFAKSKSGQKANGAKPSGGKGKRQFSGTAEQGLKRKAR